MYGSARIVPSGENGRKRARPDIDGTSQISGLEIECNEYVTNVSPGAENLDVKLILI